MEVTLFTPQIYTEHFDIPPSVGTFSEHLPAKFHPLLPAKERKLQPHLLDAELICCLASLQILGPIHSLKLHTSSLHSEPGDTASLETAVFCPLLKLNWEQLPA